MSTPDPAKRRFLIITLCKFAGLVVMLAAIWALSTDRVPMGGSSLVFGLPMLAVGVTLSMLIPRMLIRRWRTPPEL